MGAPEEMGVFMEKCGGCGDCVLHLTGGICPMARCAKSLMNGPCGGSQNGKCEISAETPCAWDQIYHSLERLGRLDLMETPLPPKDWRPSRSGGPRKIVRKEYGHGREERRQLEGTEHEVGQRAGARPRAGRFAVTAEIGPPKSSSPETIHQARPGPCEGTPMPST